MRSRKMPKICGELNFKSILILKFWRLWIYPLFYTFLGAIYFPLKEIQQNSHSEMETNQLTLLWPECGLKKSR